MTLNDLIEALEELRKKYPAAGLAYVNGDVDLEAIRYELGEVWLDEGEDEYGMYGDDTDYDDIEDSPVGR